MPRRHRQTLFISIPQDHKTAISLDLWSKKFSSSPVFSSHKPSGPLVLWSSSPPVLLSLIYITLYSSCLEFSVKLTNFQDILTENCVKKPLIACLPHIIPLPLPRFLTKGKPLRQSAHHHHYSTLYEKNYYCPLNFF